MRLIDSDEREFEDDSSKGDEVTQKGSFGVKSLHVSRFIYSLHQNRGFASPSYFPTFKTKETEHYNAMLLELGFKLGKQEKVTIGDDELENVDKDLDDLED